MKKPYLVEFEYEYYCQGFEWTTTTMLVYAENFMQACGKVRESTRFREARNFKNRTIE